MDTAVPLSPSTDPASAAAAAAAIFSPPHAAPPQPPPQAPPAPVAATPAPEPSRTVTMTLEQVQVLLAAKDQLAGIEAKRVDAERAAEEEKAKHLAKQGEWEKGFSKLKSDKDAEIQAERNKVALQESQTKRYVLDRELAIAFSDKKLVPGAAEMLAKVWSDEFAVRAEGDRFTVQNPRTFQSVQDFVTENLKRPPFNSFVQADNPAGGTANGPSSASVAPLITVQPPAATPQPKNFGEAIILQIQADKAAKPGGGNVHVDMSQGMLRGVR